LAKLRPGETAVVTGLGDGTAIDAGREGRDSLLTRLRDLGFVAGARCEVVARMWLGGDPIAVRIGGSTFALRRAEAAAVQVARLGVEQAARQTLAREDAGAATA
jgi:ferrous iron transport protein A